MTSWVDPVDNFRAVRCYLTFAEVIVDVLQGETTRSKEGAKG